MCLKWQKIHLNRPNLEQIMMNISTSPAGSSFVEVVAVATLWVEFSF